MPRECLGSPNSAGSRYAWQQVANGMRTKFLEVSVQACPWSEVDKGAAAAGSGVNARASISDLPSTAEENRIGAAASALARAVQLRSVRDSLRLQDATDAAGAGRPDLGVESGSD